LEVPTTPAGELWLYFTEPNPARTIPAWKVLTGALTAAEMQAAFGGRIVFIGSGAAGLRDLVATPLRDREIGVMVHTQAVEQMILGRYLVRPDWAIGLERSLLLVMGLLLALLLPRLGAMRGAVLGAVAVAAMVLGSWGAFMRYQYLLDPTYPVLGLLLVYIVGTGVTFYREERQRAYIHRAFDRYLSPTLVKRIVDDPGQLELGGEVREMTVLFCDIRRFSAISEKMGPQEIIRFLIAFLTPMCDILLARKATIDKFIGDAILAFWNAPLDDPDQHVNAARGALEMVARLEQMNRVMAEQSATPWPANVKIGIGLNSGPCCVGNMGSAQRLSYSLIGDTVNLASRLEGLTKYYGVPIVIGAALHAHLPDFATLPLDRVRVVGRETPEQIYALVGSEDLALAPGFRRMQAMHADMLAAYTDRNWTLARAWIAAAAPYAAQFGLDGLYSAYRDRIARLEMQPPGDDWDGIFEPTDK
jgi:adenylate cyclase